MCNVKGHLKCNTVFFIKTHWRLDSNIVFSSEDRSSAFVFCFLFLIISTLAQCIFVYLFFLEYLCYSESFVRKSRKWHTALKKKKLFYWTIEQANQKKKMFTSFWLLGASSTTVHLHFWVSCVKYKEVSLSLFTLNLYRVCSTHSTVLLKYC